MIAVTQGGATHANWRVPGATTFEPMGLEPSIHTTAVYAHGDYAVSTTLVIAQKHTLYLWKVAQGNRLT